MPNTIRKSQRKLFSRERRRGRSKRGAFKRSAKPDVWRKEIRAAEQSASRLSDQTLRDTADRCREEFAETNDEAVVVQFAGLIAESVYRSNRFRLFDVQINAIAAAASGAIAEMQTGEGKTIVTGAIAALQSLVAPSVHVGTTNTYLAGRDLESLVGTFDRLGITYGLLPEESNESESRRVYANQIVYGPGYQYGFDYLRDQMYLRDNRQSALGATTVNRIRGLDPYRKLIQPRDHHIALIDEADSVMIDEAMTPLVISLPTKDVEDPTPYLIAKQIVSEFTEGIQYTLAMPSKRIEVTDEANQLAHDKIADKQDLNLSRPWRIYITNAIRASQTYHRDVDYVVVDQKVQIVDQNTGRILPDRTWQDGLHQAVEAKEDVPIQPGRESTTQITRQRYLQMYDQLAGLTGTASSVHKEFQSVYGCPVVPIATNKRCIRELIQPRFFADLDSKLHAIADDVANRHQTGQPILVGTKTIRESIEVNEVLTARGLNATVLNGVQDEEEAEIVARAGTAGSITIATNMAGRGTDIKLDPKAIDSGGLHVIGVTPNNSKRIDRQLVGRAARQGQPGSAQFFAAATDPVFVDNESGLTKQIKRRARSNGEAGNFAKELSALQMTIEARNFKQRQNMILRDHWMDTVREAIEKD